MKSDSIDMTTIVLGYLGIFFFFLYRFTRMQKYRFQNEKISRDFENQYFHISEQALMNNIECAYKRPENRP